MSSAGLLGDTRDMCQEMTPVAGASSVSPSHICKLGEDLEDIFLSTSDRAHEIAKKTILVACGSVLAGFGGRIPFIEPSITYAGKNKALAGALVYGNFASFGCLMTYANYMTVTQIMRHKGDTKTTCSKPVIYTGASIIGVISVTSLAVTAYVFNNHNPLMPLTVYICDSGTSIYGLISNDRLAVKEQLKGFEKKLGELRSHFIDEVKNTLTAFQGFDPKARKIILRALNSIRTQRQSSPLTNRTENITSAISTITRYGAPRKKSTMDTCLYYTGQIKGAALTAAHAVIFFTLNKVGAALIWNNDYFSYSIATVFTSINILMGGKILLNASSSYLQSVWAWLSFQPQKALSMVDQMSPAISLSLKLIALITAGLSFGPPALVCQTYYTGGFEKIMEVGESAAVAVIVSFVIIRITEALTKITLLKKGSNEHKQMLQLENDLRQFIYVLQTSPILEFAKFTNLLPKAKLDAMLKKLSITRSQLQEYLTDVQA